ncbi:SDR family oxidoreductase [Dinoroseobacter sp. S76]|uniref:SDR family oxidoreductase n=1 Tax=Dinoroseobacter sp. S76 TaxID=3415124 RepID=UPI003C7E1573
MKTVLVAGATGYLGRHIVEKYAANGWHVRALVRNAAKARAANLPAHDFFEGEATDPDSLKGIMQGVDLVVSSLGITRQRDGLGYWDVDYQANLNLLTEALANGVPQFAYVHVLNADKMPNVPLAAAKQAFAERLSAAPIRSTIIAPSGFFSDMGDFLAMARAGRVWLFGNGTLRLNPIDGADLASEIAAAIAENREFVPVGGPDIFTQTELAEAAFAALGRPARITHLPDWIRGAAIKLLPWVTPAHIHGPALFFLSALGQDMTAPPRGTKRLAAHFDERACKDQEAPAAEQTASTA